MRLYPAPSASGLSPADLSNTSDAAKGDALVGFKALGTGAVGRPLHDKLTDPTEWVSALDYDLANDDTLDQTTRLQNALTAASDKGLVLPPWDIKTTATLNIPANVRIVAPFTRIFNTTTRFNFLSAGANSDISIFGLELEGPGTATLDSAASGFTVAGANSTSYAKRIRLRECYFHSLAWHAVDLHYVEDVLVENCRIEQVGHAGISGLSVSRVEVTSGTLIDTVIKRTSDATAYGVQFSQSTNGEPRSVDCMVEGALIKNIPDWEALDTHGGKRIRFLNNYIENCAIAINIGAVTVSGTDYEAPQDCIAAFNIAYGNRTNCGIVVRGSGAPGNVIERARGCIVAHNDLYDFGFGSNLTSGSINGAIHYSVTESIKVHGNNVYRPVMGILGYRDNIRFDVQHNWVIDPHDDTTTFPAGFAWRSTGNQGYVSDNVALKSGNVTDTYVGIYGFYSSHNTDQNIRFGTNYTNCTTEYQGLTAKDNVRYLTLGEFSAIKEPVRYVTTAALSGTNSGYTVSSDFLTLTAAANGVLPAFFDGSTPALGDRVLLRAEGSSVNNGIYVVMDLGSVSTPYVLKRAPDADTNAKLVPKMLVWVKEGTTGNAFNSSWYYMTNTSAVTLGTTALTFSAINVSSSRGLTLTGHLISGGTAPSAAAGAGAGTSPTVASMSGSADLAGVIDITTGTTPSASATLVTITYAVAHTVKPRVILQPANAAAAALSGAKKVFVNHSSSSTTVFIITTGSTALDASTQYVWYYHAIQ